MNDSQNAIGLIPNTGLITAEELLKRLRLANLGNLKSDIEKKGVKHISIGGKRLYRCESLVCLFGDVQ